MLDPADSSAFLDDFLQLQKKVAFFGIFNSLSQTVLKLGSPGVAGAVVRAEVVEHARGEKIVVFRYKSKVRYRRKTGHRQALTRLRITDILLDGHSTAAAPAHAAAAEPRATDRVDAPTEPVLEETAPTALGPAGSATAATAAADRATAEAETDLPASAGEAGPPPEEDEPERTGV